MKPEFFFIEYANTDLRKNPEFLLIFSDYLDCHYQEIHEEAGYIPSFKAPPLDDPVFFHRPVGHGGGGIKRIIEKLISDYESLKVHLDEVCPTAILYHAANIKWLDKDNWEAVINTCACEGAFYWAMHAQGCRDKCKYNMMGERDPFNQARENACFICDWMAFRDMLSRWAAGGDILPDHQGLVEAFNQLNHREYAIRKNGSLENYEYLSLLENMDWFSAPQRFSQIVLAVLWHDINRFLSQEKAKKNSPDPAQLIKQCRICGKFFIAPKSISTNCDNCGGKETPEALRKRQANRRAKNERNILIKLRKIGRNRGKNDSEINEILEHFGREGYKPKDILKMPETDIFPPET